MKSDDRIYLDYAAATPIDADVLAAMLPYFDARYSNPSSMHASGRAARQAIERARARVAGVLACAPEEIVFTGSGTESDNLALLGAARANRARGNHIIVSAIEHKAVLESARALQKEGFVVSTLPVDRCGSIDIGECLRLVRDDTTVLSVMYANNEIGTIEPIAELAAAIRRARGSGPYPLVHTDACQAAGFLTLDVQALGVDLMTLNGSKIYGPKGIGMLYKRNGVMLQPHVLGGEQERSLRAGTESVPLIVGFAEALQKADGMREAESLRLGALRDHFIRTVRAAIPNAVLNGHATRRLPNNVSVSIPHVEGESILLTLDAYGIEASTGSACSAHDLKPSHVLLAVGQDAELAHGSLRFSLGRDTTKERLDYAASTLATTVEWLARVSALTTSL